jgi:hypothetical protein
MGLALLHLSDPRHSDAKTPFSACRTMMSSDDRSRNLPEGNFHFLIASELAPTIRIMVFILERVSSDMGGTPLPRGTGVSPVGSRDGSSKQNTMPFRSILLQRF